MDKTSWVLLALMAATLGVMAGINFSTQTLLVIGNVALAVLGIVAAFLCYVLLIGFYDSGFDFENIGLMIKTCIWFSGVLGTTVCCAFFPMWLAWLVRYATGW